MIHPDVNLRFINREMGYGIFANKFIPKGTITYVQDDLEIIVKEQDFQQYTSILKNEVEKYSYINANGERILSWDLSKYVNHSCNPNTMSTGYGFEIAIKDIFVGEQLTDEYAIFNLIADMPCDCGSVNCRAKIKADDFEKLHHKWDELLKPAVLNLKSVAQPLFSILDQNTVEEL